MYTLLVRVRAGSSTYLMVEGLPLDSSGVTFDGAVPLRAGRYDACSGGHGGCKVPTQHFTMVFHAFVFLQGNRTRAATDRQTRARRGTHAADLITCKASVLW